jgi:zinc/manganese transport system substrate-binding protein
MGRFLRAAAIAAFLGLPAIAHAAVLSVVAAENFYGDVAGQIGGSDVAVTSILSNPDVDPHLFEASPSVARAVAGARIVIANGIEYDPWVQSLLSASRRKGQTVIVVADLVGRKPGDNPHIWYEPKTMLALARALAQAFAAEDPAHAPAYASRLRQFEASITPIESKIASLHMKLAGTKVTATEPVFGYMFAALGMEVLNRSFQVAVMNNTEPSASDVAAFENDLRSRRVALLVYNSQASDPIAERMERIAGEAGVPVVGASETEPPGMTYQAWMLSELDAVSRALVHNR